jgi:deoxyadenosine/deoxycytidine kinase
MAQDGLVTATQVERPIEDISRTLETLARKEEELFHTTLELLNSREDIGNQPVKILYVSGIFGVGKSDTVEALRQEFGFRGISTVTVEEPVESNLALKLSVDEDSEYRKTALRTAQQHFVVMTYHGMYLAYKDLSNTSGGGVLIVDQPPRGHKVIRKLKEEDEGFPYYDRILIDGIDTELEQLFNQLPGNRRTALLCGNPNEVYSWIEQRGRDWEVGKRIYMPERQIVLQEALLREFGCPVPTMDRVHQEMATEPGDIRHIIGSQYSVTEYNVFINVTGSGMNPEVIALILANYATGKISYSYSHLWGGNGNGHR